MINIDGSMVIWIMAPIYVGVPIWWFFRSVRRFNRDQAEIRSALSDLDVALLRRHDLVKRLVEAARPHATDDRNAVSDLMHYQERAIGTRWNVSTHSKDEAKLDEAIVAVYAILDKAELNGDARFLRDLKREFRGSDKHVDVAIRTYNARVDRYNARLKLFPYSILAKRVMHLRPEDNYKTAQELRTKADVRMEVVQNPNPKREGVR